VGSLRSGRARASASTPRQLPAFSGSLEHLRKPPAIPLPSRARTKDTIRAALISCRSRPGAGKTPAATWRAGKPCGKIESHSPNRSTRFRFGGAAKKLAVPEKNAAVPTESHSKILGASANNIKKWTSTLPLGLAHLVNQAFSAPANHARQRHSLFSRAGAETLSLHRKAPAAPSRDLRAADQILKQSHIEIDQKRQSAGTRRANPAHLPPEFSPPIEIFFCQCCQKSVLPRGGAATAPAFSFKRQRRSLGEACQGERLTAVSK